MDGLEVSENISKLTRQIDALERVMIKISDYEDFGYEFRFLKSIKEVLENQRTEFEDKLRSVRF